MRLQVAGQEGPGEGTGSNQSSIPGRVMFSLLRPLASFQSPCPHSCCPSSSQRGLEEGRGDMKVLEDTQGYSLSSYPVIWALAPNHSELQPKKRSKLAVVSATLRVALFKMRAQYVVLKKKS
jgi:hypothetical protein